MTSGYADTKTVGSYLNAPTVDSGGTVADKIAKQGPQVQVVNWIWERVTGKDLVEALITPITGDWARIAANGKAWCNVGDALEQISGNLSDNVGKLDPHWSGAAAQAFRRHIEVAWFAGLYAEGAVARTIGKGFEFVADQSERLCWEALDLITKLVNKLLSAAATFAIPLVGQARAIKIVWDAYQIYQAIMGIYRVIQATINAMSQLVRSLGNIKAALESIKDVRNPSARSLRIPQTPPLSEDDIRRIEEAARARDAAREMRELQRRIDGGEFTWRDIAEGRHLDDPGVRAVLGSNLDQMARVYQQFEEGYHLDEVVEAHQPRGVSSRRCEPDDDDDNGEWFVDSIYDGRSR